MTVEHHYRAGMSWVHPEGTGAFHSYPRDHEMRFDSKLHSLPGSSPPFYRGDATRYNSGELLVAAVAQSHMLRFLEVASEVGLIVLEYFDEAVGTTLVEARGDGQVASVVMRPRVVARRGPMANDREVRKLHERASGMSIIAATVSCPIEVLSEPLVVVD